jgi:hypothetical protein
MPQIIYAVPLVNFYLVSEYDTDCPRSYCLASCQFLIDRRPHHLIICFPSCTLRVSPFPFVSLTRSSLMHPQTTQILSCGGHSRPYYRFY